MIVPDSPFPTRIHQLGVPKTASHAQQTVGFLPVDVFRWFWGLWTCRSSRSGDWAARHVGFALWTGGISCTRHARPLIGCSCEGGRCPPACAKETIHRAHQLGRHGLRRSLVRRAPPLRPAAVSARPHAGRWPGKNVARLLAFSQLPGVARGRIGDQRPEGGLDGDYDEPGDDYLRDKHCDDRMRLSQRRLFRSRRLNRPAQHAFQCATPSGGRRSLDEASGQIWYRCAARAGIGARRRRDFETSWLVRAPPTGCCAARCRLSLFLRASCSAPR